MRSRLKNAQVDLVSLADYETHLSGNTQFLLDAVLGLINTKQNDIFTVLTIVSVVGIPPTLVASIYGMNFKNMPELDWPWGLSIRLGTDRAQHHPVNLVVQTARVAVALIPLKPLYVATKKYRWPVASTCLDERLSTHK